MKRAVVRGLLAGEIVCSTRNTARADTWLGGSLALPGAMVLLVAAVGLAIYAARLGGEAQACAFLGAGAALLGSLLRLTNMQLRSGGSHSTLLHGAALARLAFRSAGQNV